MTGKEKKPVSDELLEILACPVCQTAVTLADHPKGGCGLKCGLCGRIYPVRDGIPVMLESESVTEQTPDDGGS